MNNFLEKIQICFIANTSDSPVEQKWAVRGRRFRQEIFGWVAMLLGIFPPSMEDAIAGLGSLVRF